MHKHSEMITSQTHRHTHVREFRLAIWCYELANYTQNTRTHYEIDEQQLVRASALAHVKHLMPVRYALRFTVAIGGVAMVKI